MKKQLFFSLAILLSFLLQACSKENPDPHDEKLGLLTNGSWTCIGEDLSVNGYSQSTYHLRPTCQNDDFIKYETDGNFITDQGSVKCDSAANQTSVRQYSFEPEENLIFIGLARYEILALTKDRFQYKTKANNNPGQFNIYTFEHR